MKKLLFILFLFISYTAISQGSTVSELDSVTTVNDNMRFFIIDPNEAIASNRNKNISVYRLDQRWSSSSGGGITSDSSYNFSQTYGGNTYSDLFNPYASSNMLWFLRKDVGSDGVLTNDYFLQFMPGGSAVFRVQSDLAITAGRDLLFYDDNGSLTSPEAEIDYGTRGFEIKSTSDIFFGSGNINSPDTMAIVDQSTGWDYNGVNIQNFGLSDNPTTTANGSLRYDNGASATLEVYDDGTSSWLEITTVTVEAGTYTPTLTTVSNLDANPTLLAASYQRTGSIVNVFIKCSVDVTSASTATFSATLPVSSDFTDTHDASGQGTVTDDTIVVVDSRDGNDDVLVTINPSVSISKDAYFSFEYEIK